MSTDFIRRIYNEFNKSKKNLRYVKESFIGVYEIGIVLKESENSIINKFNEVILEYYRRLGDDIKAKLCDEDELPDLFFISFDCDGFSTPYLFKHVCFILFRISSFSIGFSTPYFSKHVFFILSLISLD